MLRDPEYGVQRGVFASARALVKLEAISAVSDIEAAKNRIPFQDHSLLESAIKKIKKNSKESPLKKEVEDLVKKVKELEDKVLQHNK